jgi:hypothetical protein
MKNKKKKVKRYKSKTFRIEPTKNSAGGDYNKITYF